MQSVTRQSREAARMTAAALAFLSTLVPAQRAEATFEFGTDERFRWHYTPIPRRGLSRGDMGPAQTAAADELLAASLTSVAARKARQIIDLETVLAKVERNTGAIRHDRTPDLYFFSVFGEPDGQEPWGWRAEGHHLSMHFTVAGGEGSLVDSCISWRPPGRGRAWSQEGPASTWRRGRPGERLDGWP